MIVNRVKFKHWLLQCYDCTYLYLFLQLQSRFQLRKNTSNCRIPMMIAVFVFAEFPRWFIKFLADKSSILLPVMLMLLVLKYWSNLQEPSSCCRCSYKFWLRNFLFLGLGHSGYGMVYQTIANHFLFPPPVLLHALPFAHAGPPLQPGFGTASLVDCLPTVPVGCGQTARFTAGIPQMNEFVACSIPNCGNLMFQCWVNNSCN